MAIIDYGALAFCNGKQINGDELFPTIEVGPVWFEFCKCWCNIRATKSDILIAQYFKADFCVCSPSGEHWFWLCGMRPWTDACASSRHRRAVAGYPQLPGNCR